MPTTPKRLFLYVAICSIAINILLVYGFRKQIYRFVNPHKKADISIHKGSEIDTNYSTYFSFDSTGSISFVPPSATAKPLPAQMIIQPGIYTIGNTATMLDREGLYRIVQADLQVQQRIVHQRNLKSLLSAICWIHTHGRTHNKLTNAQRIDKSKGGKLYLSCSRITDYAVYLLRQQGYKTRKADGYTLEASNGHDDAHSMIEVYDPAIQKWIVADLDNNNLFATKTDTGKLLSYAEMHTALFSNNLQFIRIAFDARINEDNTIDDYPYKLLYERFHSRVKMANWYKRVCGIMLIDDHFYNAKDSVAVRKYRSTYQYIDSTKFMELYYGTK